jgi:hypothetical protein
MTDDLNQNDRTRTHFVLTEGMAVSHYRIIEKIGAARKLTAGQRPGPRRASGGPPTGQRLPIFAPKLGEKDVR